MTSSRTTSLSVRMPNDLHAWVKAEAERLGVPMSRVVVQTLERRHARFTSLTYHGMNLERTRPDGDT